MSTTVDRSKCVEWSWNRDAKGYGRFHFGAKMRKAHRMAYEARFGPIPEGLLVCHRCDNPGCVNTAHLFLGTHADNMRDKRVKGRSGKCFGEKHGMGARYSDAQVAEARTRFANGEKCKPIADSMGVSISTVWNWIHNPYRREGSKRVGPILQGSSSDIR